MIMGYDEHFGGSPESGSVASIDYVKDGIKETLKDVPAEKVINAMPLYTRLWKEVPKSEAELAKEAGTEAANYPMKVINAMPLYTRLWKEVPKSEAELAKEAGTEAANYPMKVTSETYAMNKARQVAEKAGGKFEWDDKTKQYFAQWESEGATYKMWLEDEKSLEEKLKVIGMIRQNSTLHSGSQKELHIRCGWKMKNHWKRS